ncbi:MAG: tetratricopeptide repeat protein [Verrucomicrobiota bacterium]
MKLSNSTNRFDRFIHFIGFVAVLLNISNSSSGEVTPVASTDLNPFVIQGYAELEAGNIQTALESFDKALQADQSDIPALLGQARIYSGQQRHEDAFHSYDSIVQIHPRHSEAWSGRGLAAFGLEDFDTALSSFIQATADQPVNGFIYESLAWIRMCRGEFNEAAETAKTATLMYNREGEKSLYPLLIAYFSYLEAGNVEDAKRTLNYAIKNNSGRKWPAPVINYLAGRIDAKTLIGFVTELAEETEAHTYIGLYLRAQGDLEKSEKHLEWVRLKGDSRVFEYTLARALNLRNRVALSN